MIGELYEAFTAEVKKLADVEPENAQDHLFKLLCNSEQAAILLMYIRYITAAHLKKNFFEYEGFVGDVPEFCAKEVETPDMECD